MAGIIVLTIGICAPDSITIANMESPKGQAQKAMLDDLHKKKIDMANEILVLNVDGYVGKSTRSEIAYAIRTNKPVKWLYPDKDKPVGWLYPDKLVAK
jgi:hypothetical protein